MKTSKIQLAALAAAACFAASAALAQQPAEGEKPAKPAAKPAAKGAGKPGTAKPGGVEAIARVNGKPVSKARADAMMQMQLARGTPDNEQTRNLIREELVNREIVAQEAVKAGFDKNPEVRTQIDMTSQDILVNAYVRDYLRQHPITDDDIEKEYERAKAQTPDKEYRARHILVETEDQAKDLIAQLKKGAKFDDLAAKNSKDPGTKDRGGDLDWTTPANLDRNFSEAMVKLDKGKYSETPVKTRFGWHVIQLDDVRPVRIPTLAEIKPRIQQQLVSARVEEMMRGLRSKAKVE
jgi:peptidyl-prolyl cis-trans isomerase C